MSDKGLTDEDMAVAAHPARRELLLELAKAPQHASKLSKRLAVNRRVLVFHLMTLDRYGFISSEFDLVREKGSKKPVAAKFFRLTRKGEHAVAIFKKLQQMQAGAGLDLGA